MSLSCQFFNLRFEVPTDKQWQLPLGLAMGIHLVVFIMLVAPPSFLFPNRDLPEVQTINLFTAEEIDQPPALPRRQKKAQEKAPPKQAQSIAMEPPPSVTPSPSKVISLRPRKVKKKIKKIVEKPPVNDNLRQRALERIQARVEKIKEEQEIKHDLSKLRELLHTTTAAKTASNTETQTGAEQVTVAAEPRQSGSSHGNSARLDEATKRYYIAISRKIHDNWALPKSQNWDKSLEAITVIVIQRNGIVSKTFFEKKSKNIYFNQYVEKTIQASAPMPPFPSDIRKRTLEIGLRFRPSGLF